MKRRWIDSCRRCGLEKYRRFPCLGRGDFPCDILMIGEAPGKTENLTGIAFHGQAGKLLDRMRKDARLMDYRTYITNVLFCRPTDVMNGPNRNPTAAEVLACAPNVQRILKFTRPRVVVLLGKVAQRYMAREYPSALYVAHPSSVLRSGGVESPNYFHVVRSLERIHGRLGAR